MAEESTGFQIPWSCLKEKEFVPNIKSLIAEEVYSAYLEECKNHLNGRVVFSKGDQPLTHLEFTKKL